MSNQKYYCGVDWGEQTSAYCIQDHEGKMVKQGKIKNLDDLEKIRQEFRDCQFLLETKHHWISRYLFKKGETVKVVTGYQSKRFAESYTGKSKTDKIDARKLADFCRTRNESIKDARYDHDERRAILNHFFELSREISDLTRQLRSEIKKYFAPLLSLFSGIEIKAIELLSSELADPENFELEKVRIYFPSRMKQREERYKKSLETFVRLSRAEEVIYIRRIQHLSHRLKLAIEEKKELTREAEENLEEEEEYIKSLPHCGTLTALTLLWIFENTTCFEEAAAYSGLAPVIYQSGNNRVVRRRAKTNRDWQSLLTSWAIFTTKYSPWAKQYWDKQREKGKKTTVIGRSLGLRWLRIAYRLYQEKRPYQEEYNQKEKSHEKSKRINKAAGNK
mgnify:CR=1 FL=1